jgi:uncharacterized protein
MRSQVLPLAALAALAIANPQPLPSPMSTSSSPTQTPAQNPANDRRIDYIELPATDVAATKQFYASAFGWKFTDYGPDYTSFEDGRLAGGLRKEPAVGRGGALIVIYSIDLAAAEAAVRRAGGTIVKPVFAFPGGRRFHFTDPSGNELAVWSER